MAEYHLEVRIISRKGGSAASASDHRSGDSVHLDACSASGYRNGQPIKNEQTSQTFYQKPEDLARIVSSHVLTPHLLHWDASRLWNEVDRVEKHPRATLAKDVNILLPHEWSLAEREAYALDFARRHYVDRGIPCEVSFHRFGKGYKPGTEAWAERLDKLKKGGPVTFYEIADIPKDPTGFYVAVFRNEQGGVREFRVRYEHVHIMHATRTLAPDGTWSNKLRAPNGHNLKWEKEQLRELRTAWAKHANQHLSPEHRISELTLQAQGIERHPQPSMGAMTALHRQGKNDKKVIEAVGRFAEVRRMNDELRHRGQLKRFGAAAISSLEHQMQEHQKRSGPMEEEEKRRLFGLKAEAPTPEQYVEELRKEQGKAYIELDKKLERQKELEASWQQSAKSATDDFERYADSTINSARDYLLDLENMRRRSEADLERNQQEEARQRTQGMMTDPQLRNAIAVGETAGTHGTWVDQCMAAHGAASAAFLREQDAYRRQLADPSISAEDKQLISLRARAEHLEYRAFYEADLVRTYRVIGGEGHIEKAKEMQDRVLQYNLTAVSLKEQHTELLRVRELGLEEKRAVGYDGPERRFTDQEFEQNHAQRLFFLTQHKASEAQIERHEEGHARQRDVRDEYEMGRRFDRRMPAEEQETGRQKENREERQSGANDVEPARVRPPRDREPRAMSDQMRAHMETEKEHTESFGQSQEQEEEQERSMGE